jgi:hypothetical protein
MVVTAGAPVAGAVLVAGVVREAAAAASGE